MSLKPTSPVDDDRAAKRVTVDVACVACRKRKKKCDGGKPRCSLCLDTGRDCSYPLDSNSAIRNDNKRLRGDLTALEAIFQRIRNSSAEDAVALVHDIQAGRAYHELGSSKGFAGDRRVSSAIQPDVPMDVTQSPTLAHSDSSDMTRKRQKVSHHVPGLEHRASNETPPEREPLPSPPDTQRNRHVFVQFINSYRHVIRDAMAMFNSINGNIFHIYTQDQVDDLCNLIAKVPADQVSNADLCEICSIAALAGQFSRKNMDPAMLDLYYSVAKQTLDDCIVARPLRALKVACLLSLFNVIVKATAALAYVHVGLSIAKYQGLEDPARPIWWDLKEWTDAKKTSRSLFFIKTWMEAALGFNFAHSALDGLDSPDDVFVDTARSDENCADFFQCEITKISILKAQIMRATNDSNLTLHDLRTLRDKLTTWYESLPEKTQLANLLTAELPRASRMTLLYMHLYHLGALMLIQRKVLHEALTSSPSDKTHWKSPQALEFVKEGFIAGRQGARILSLMQDEDGALSRQCWITIFHSFIACSTALYCTFQRITRGHSPSTWIEDAHLARRSFRALCLCAEIDVVARKLQGRLEPYLSLLSAIEVAESRSKPRSPSKEHLFDSEDLLASPCDDFAFTLYPPEGGDAAKVACRELVDIVTQPFACISTTSSPVCGSCATSVDSGYSSIRASRGPYFPPSQSPSNLDEMGLGAHVEWDWYALNKKDGSLHRQHPGHSLPKSSSEVGVFNEGSNPYGWPPSRSNSDYVAGASTLEPLVSAANITTLNRARDP